jgi:ABC-type nitrate/sulfonate/bicarbonate transport system substrate-binding protein
MFGAGVVLAALVALAATQSQGARADRKASVSQSPAKLKIAVAVNAQLLPLFVGVDNGDFKRAKVDLDVETFAGSSAAQFPRLVRGDVDVLPATASPPMFNSVSQGFDIKAIFSAGTSGPVGAPVMVTVGSGVGSIKKLSDIKGKKVDGGAEGTVLQLLALETLRKARLKPSNVELSYRGRTPANLLALARSRAVDMAAMIEPTAGQVEQQRLGKRKPFLNLFRIAPWYPEVVMLASPSVIAKKRAALERFTAVYLKISRKINKHKGKWTPALVATMAKWTKTPADVIRADKLPSFEPNGLLSAGTLSRIQNIWLGQKLVTKRVDAGKLLDMRGTQRVLRKIGRAKTAR